MSEWIGDVVIPPEVAEKIKRKHGVTPEEVREAVCWGAAEEARWHDHEVHGRRLLVIGTPYHGSYRLMVVLAPDASTSGTWNCRTAIRLTK